MYPLYFTVCDALPNPANGFVRITGTGVNDIATYCCDPGYDISTGNNTQICQSNGKWSGPPPICKG